MTGASRTRPRGPTPPELPTSTTVDVLAVADDAGTRAVRSSLSGDRFDVRTATPPVDARDVAAGPDCVVYGPTATPRAGLELLAAVRERSSSPAFVVVAGSATPETAESVARRDRAVLLPTGEAGPPPALRGCVARLVDHARVRSLARRALAAVETSGEGVAIADPDGTLAFVTRAFAGRFGSATEDLRGRHWESCFPPREVDRLRADALTAVREGWQWDGGCEGLRADGATVPLGVRLAGLDDGSLVFRVAPPETET